MRVHIVTFPAADGDGVRMTAYEDEDDARTAISLLSGSVDGLRLASLNVIPKGEQ